VTQVISTHLGEALGTDFFSVREQFTDEQWSHFVTVRPFADEEVVPVIGGYKARAITADARDMLGGNGIYSTTRSCGTWPTWRPSTPSRAPRPCRP
jgi:hypothetical protein